MNQKIMIAIVAVVIIIIIGSIYYFSQNNNSGQSTPTPTPTPSIQGSNQISIKNFSFNPSELTINKGETVTWINNESTPHDIKGSAIQDSKNSFQSAILNKGQDYSFTFSDSGTYDYICGIHPAMKGKIIVK